MLAPLNFAPIRLASHPPIHSAIHPSSHRSIHLSKLQSIHPTIHRSFLLPPSIHSTILPSMHQPFIPTTCHETVQATHPPFPPPTLHSVHVKVCQAHHKRLPKVRPKSTIRPKALLTRGTQKSPIACSSACHTQTVTSHFLTRFTAPLWRRTKTPVATAEAQF